MHIFSLDPQNGAPVREFASRGASAVEFGQGTGEAHAFVLRFERGGLIGSHPAGFGQLFVPVQGSGWIAGADGARHELRPGQAAFISRGETHSKGSEQGMTAVMVQIQEFSLNVPRVSSRGDR
jgi:quercetin dioxygenase-like cupin family protein